MTLLPTVRTAIPEVGIGRITPEIVSEIFSGLDLTEGTRIQYERGISGLFCYLGLRSIPVCGLTSRSSRLDLDLPRFHGGAAGGRSITTNCPSATS